MPPRNNLLTSIEMPIIFLPQSFCPFFRIFELPTRFFNLLAHLFAQEFIFDLFALVGKSSNLLAHLFAQEFIFDHFALVGKSSNLLAHLFAQEFIFDLFAHDEYNYMRRDRDTRVNWI